jgi:hypothetical protein
MCQGVSCEVGIHGDEVVVWFGDPEEMSKERDSHAAIRKFHKLPEINSVEWSRTPLEFYFHDTTEPANQMELHFDEGQPNWWNEEVEATVRGKVQEELNLRDSIHRKKKVWPGFAKFIGRNVSVNWSGGDVDASAATSVSLPQHRTGYVYARAATSVSLPQHRTGTVYASAAIQQKISEITKKNNAKDAKHKK